MKEEVRIYYERIDNGSIDHVNVQMPKNAGQVYSVTIVDTEDHDRVLQKLKEKR